MKYTLALFLLCSPLLKAQNIYPQDYFQSPLDITLVMAGTFAELRSNHFHSGIDIKTQQVEGLKIYAAADGYISRIKIAHFGYGKAIYITHPNGYTTVYAHLQRLSPTLEAYIKKLQYEQESYEVEVFPNPDELIVSKGEVVAYSGNTGSSGGPHLHFEIRDNAERPINPMLFGLDIKDTTPPFIKNVYAYPIGPDAHINKSNEKQKLRLIRQPNNDYVVENVEAYGKIGFAIEANDRQDLAYNNNGLYNIQTFMNGNQKIEIDFHKFSFDESSHINRFIDYEQYINEKHRLQKLYRDTNNPLSIYKNLDDEGYLQIQDSTSSIYKVKVSDYKSNNTWLTINIKGKKYDTIKKEEAFKSNYFIYANKTNELVHDKVAVEFPSNTFYEDFYMDFAQTNDTIKLHDESIAAQKYFTITYDLSHYKPEDLEQLYIGRLVGYYKRPYYSSTKKEGHILSTRTKTLGIYALAKDTVDPTIKPINFSDGKWVSNFRYLKLKIEDKESGISKYRATVNGKFILMEYEYKDDMLTFDFNDNVITETENNLKVIVTDNVGNSSTFEATFYRK